MSGDRLRRRVVSGVATLVCNGRADDLLGNVSQLPVLQLGGRPECVKGQVPAVRPAGADARAARSGKWCDTPTGHGPHPAGTGGYEEDRWSPVTPREEPTDTLRGDRLQRDEAPTGGVVVAPRLHPPLAVDCFHHTVNG